MYRLKNAGSRSEPRQLIAPDCRSRLPGRNRMYCLSVHVLHCFALASILRSYLLSRPVSRTANKVFLSVKTLFPDCFTISPPAAFLPSTFSMYGLTASAAALLANRPATAVALAAAGVVLGWPFSILATVPIVLFALFTGGFWKVFAAGGIASLVTLVSRSAVFISAS